jgi:putative ABC transport system permease protein
MRTLPLAWRSIRNRRLGALLTALAIALAVTLLLGVERLRHEARAGFASTISGTDLIVGARTSPVQLLLYSVFRMGDPTNNISWESVQELADHPRVAWTVPLSLGDSHRGYAVLGTTRAYFERYRYGRDRPLRIAEGRLFDDLYDAVLGAEVARALGYGPGREIVLAHGAADVQFARHDDKPFTVVGVLAPTGTPVDHTVHVSLEGIEAIHVGWEAGAPMPGRTVSAEATRAMDLTPQAVTAVLVGLHAKVHSFHVQRWVNEYPEEPLLAILPGVALHQLWEVVGVAEGALLAVSWFVVLVGVLGMLTALLTSLDARRREMAILRAVGAGPRHVFLLVAGEALLLTALGAAAGLLVFYGLLAAAQPLAAEQVGIHLGLAPPSPRELGLLGAVCAAGLAAGLLPALRAYRQSLADGITMRL